MFTMDQTREREVSQNYWKDQTAHFSKQFFLILKEREYVRKRAWKSCGSSQVRKICQEWIQRDKILLNEGGWLILLFCGLNNEIVLLSWMDQMETHSTFYPSKRQTPDTSIAQVKFHFLFLFSYGTHFIQKNGFNHHTEHKGNIQVT